MSAEQAAGIATAMVSLLWVGLAGYVLYLLRNSLPTALERLTGLEAYGVKLSLSGGQAMAAAVEMARKNPTWKVDVPEADRQRALDRANRDRRLIEGAEILWVDDSPSNNRNEARMLRSFGAMITFACTTEEAIRAVRAGEEQARPFHLVLSDISRDLPLRDPTAGLTMLQLFRKKKLSLPVVFYVGNREPGAPVPSGAFGLTNRPDELLQLTLDALARVRGGQ
jgi:CheY-like chemotaxis protein